MRRRRTDPAEAGAGSGPAVTIVRQVARPAARVSMTAGRPWRGPDPLKDGTQSWHAVHVLDSAQSRRVTGLDDPIWRPLSGG